VTVNQRVIGSIPILSVFILCTTLYKNVSYVYELIV
jgi:hypothetical protein